MRDRFEVKRKRAVERIRAKLERRGSPRAQMSMIVVAAGSAGFLCSFVLLQLGLRLMWLRYGLAIALAYGVFFLLVGAWLTHQRRKLARREIRSRSGSTAEDVLDIVDAVGDAARLAVRIDPGGAGADAAESAARFAWRREPVRRRRRIAGFRPRGCRSPRGRAGPGAARRGIEQR
jgi:hypothetical protein